MRAIEISRRAAVSLAVGMLALGQALGGQDGYPETVTVGNPGNVADATGYGAVPYAYRIGKFEVTNKDYCEFLNAVEKTGKYNMWRWQMGEKEYGGIKRSGDATNYVYTVKEGMTNKPAVLMNWYEALRFCNWLSNGKGEGSVDTGPYTFTNEWGSMTVKMPDHAALADRTEVKWVLASENEWYKAAYFDPNKEGGAGYWMYPAGSDSVPEANLNSNEPREVGTFKKSSPYGTFDQGGNVWEWNETRESGNCGVRGGSYWINDHAGYMRSSARWVSNPPEFVYDNYGFRVVALGAAEPQAAAPAVPR